MSKIVTVFSLEKGWGGDFLTTSLLVTLLAAVGVMSLFLLVRSRDLLNRQRLTAISAACVAATVSYLTNVYLLDPDNGVRYFIPILIAVASATLLLLGRTGLSLPSQQNLKQSVIATAGGIVVLGVALVIGGVFSKELVNRSQRVYKQRTLLSFPIFDRYLAYNDAMLGKKGATWVHNRQHKIEAGGAILAIMAFPFHLDFSRNLIFTANESTFLTPWSDFPLNADPEAVRKYLSDRGIRFVMFQYRGFSMKSKSKFNNDRYSPYWMIRKVGETNISFRKALRYLAENSHLIDANAGLVIMDISRKSPLPSPISWGEN